MVCLLVDLDEAVKKGSEEQDPLEEGSTHQSAHDCNVHDLQHVREGCEPE